MPAPPAPTITTSNTWVCMWRVSRELVAGQPMFGSNVKITRLPSRTVKTVAM
jgi:hypothetical protein